MTDEDTDSNILNNQAVLAYQKNNYEGCISIFIAYQVRFCMNATSYFNYMILCWEAGIFTDEFILQEIDKVSVNPYTGRSFTSYMYALIYEAQNNWQAAKANYSLAFQSASDGIIAQMKNRLKNCT